TMAIPVQQQRRVTGQWHQTSRGPVLVWPSARPANPAHRLTGRCHEEDGLIVEVGDEHPATWKLTQCSHGSERLRSDPGWTIQRERWHGLAVHCCNTADHREKCGRTMSMTVQLALLLHGLTACASAAGPIRRVCPAS